MVFGCFFFDSVLGFVLFINGEGCGQENKEGANKRTSTGFFSSVFIHTHSTIVHKQEIS